MSLFPSDLWQDEPIKGDMFIWARPKRSRPGEWALGLGYWNVSGGWSDAYNSHMAQYATKFHPMPEPPKS